VRRSPSKMPGYFVSSKTGTVGYIVSFDLGTFQVRFKNK